MGFKARERKRRRRIAQSNAQRNGRRSGSSAAKWWLTIATKTTCCARCARIIRPGDELVYRHTPREARCVRCGDRLEDSKGYRPSLRWERERKGKVLG